MNCNCLTEIKVKLLEHVKQPGRFKKPVNKLEITGTTMLLKDAGLFTRTCSQVEVELEGQKKLETFPLVHTFCPFCGKKQEAEA